MVLLWVVLLILGVVADVHTGALVGVWVAAGALLAGVLAALGIPPSEQAAVFAAASGVLLLAVRPLAVRHRGAAALDPELLVGKLGTVLDPVDEELASGRIVIEGVPYVARAATGSDPVPAGAPVRVSAVESGELVIERL